MEGEALDAWLGRFKSQQDTLGALNDLLVLHQAMADQLLGNPAQLVPELCARLQEQQRQLWQQWQSQASSMLGESGRNALHDLLCHGSLCPDASCDAAESLQQSERGTPRSRAADLVQS